MPNRKARRAARKFYRDLEKHATGMAEIRTDSNGNMSGTFWDADGRVVDNALGSDGVSRMASEFFERDIKFEVNERTTKGDNGTA